MTASCQLGSCSVGRGGTSAVRTLITLPITTSSAVRSRSVSSRSDCCCRCRSMSDCILRSVTLRVARDDARDCERNNPDLRRSYHGSFLLPVPLPLRGFSLERYAGIVVPVSAVAQPEQQLVQCAAHRRDPAEQRQQHD